MLYSILSNKYPLKFDLNCPCHFRTILRVLYILLYMHLQNAQYIQIHGAHRYNKLVTCIRLFLILIWNFSHYICVILAVFLQLNFFFVYFKFRKTHFKTAEIMWKVPFQIRKSSTKFHIQVRKPYLNCEKSFSKGIWKETVTTKMY